MDMEARIAALEEGLRALSDQLEIMRLIAAYGPAADSRDGPAYRTLFTADAVYEAPGIDSWHGIDKLEDMITRDPRHEKLVGEGCAHVGSLPHITVAGDEAVVINYSRLYHAAHGEAHDLGGGGMEVMRVSAVRNDLVRTPDGWRIKRRVVIPLEGAKAATDLLQTAFE